MQTREVTRPPPALLGSWSAFARTPDGQTMLMEVWWSPKGELASVTDAVQAGGLQRTTLHKHLLEQSPPIWWTHIARPATPPTWPVRSGRRWMPPTLPASATSGGRSLDLDTAIDEALGRSGTIAGRW